MLLPFTVPHNRASIDILDTGDATATVTGTAEFGETLTCTFNDDDPDGPALSSPTFQWIRNASTTIVGATNSTYVLTLSDIGATIKCRVSYTDLLGFAELITSNVTATVTTGPDTGDATATVTGTPEFGETLTCTFNNNDPDGAAVAGPTFQWMRGASTIGGATASTYVAVLADIGTNVKCRVTYTDGNGNSETIDSNSVAVTAGPDTGNGTATVTGTAQEGQTLTCTFNNDDPDGASVAGPTYQWIRGAATTIGGATSSTYAATATDVGSTLKCRVSYTDGNGNSETIDSNNTATVTASDSGDATASVAWVNGVAQVGQTIVVTFNNNDPDGAAISGPTYQWFRNNHSTLIGGATSSSYVATASDAGHTLSCRCSYTDGQGFSEVIFSSLSATVAAISTGVYTQIDSGSGTLAVPHYNTMLIECWGAGGPGLNWLRSATGYSTRRGQTDGSDTTILGLTAGGGQRSSAADVTLAALTPVSWSGGAGGTASGGDTNTSGSAGGGGQMTNGGGPHASGAGGNAAGGGGAGAPSVTDTDIGTASVQNGSNGSAPGGGGAGGSQYVSGYNAAAPGGGGGAYCAKTYTFGAGGPTPGASMSYGVGVGGVPLDAGGDVAELNSGGGANGRIKITVLS